MVMVIVGETCTFSLQFQGKNVYSAHSCTCILQSLTQMTDKWLQKKGILHVNIFLALTIIIH